MKTTPSTKSKILCRVLPAVLLAVLVAVLAYACYVFFSYHRIGSRTEPVLGHASDTVQTDTPYTILSWNIGFGAYTDDFDFFMDGGTQSWAFSKERLEENLQHMVQTLKTQNSDFLLLQEVDIGGTRSYHIDQRDWFTQAFSDAYCYTSAQNYDSPFLLYPLYQPHGANRSALLTLSRGQMHTAERVELPVEEGFTKILDLDRCYSRQLLPMENGKTLVLYNLHLSAYTTDGTIAQEQLCLLLADMQQQYENGSYCIAGGDFNKDLLGDSSAYFGVDGGAYTWAQPIPAETFANRNIRLVPPLNPAQPVPSCRNADAPYHPAQYVLTVDGFLVSDNVQVLSADVLDLHFAYSDHNPVTMTFQLCP